MNCLLNSASNKILNDLAFKYGAEEGLKKYIKLKQVLKNYRKEVSFAQQINIKKKIGEYNKENNTSYFINFTKVGQADLYTWELENKNPVTVAKPLLTKEQEKKAKEEYIAKLKKEEENKIKEWYENNDFYLDDEVLREQEQKDLEYSISPETLIKPGVEELFNNNPELANAVYSKILTNSGISAENLLSLLLKDNLIEKQCS